FLGYTKEEMLGMSVSQIEVNESPEEILYHINKVKTHHFDRFESRHRHKDGRVVDVEVSLQYLPVNGGRMYCFIRDITAKKRAEEALHKSELLRRQSQMSPHFIFNAINSVQSYVFQNKTEDAIRFLGVFAKIIRSTLDFTTRHQISLAEELEYLDCYFDIENMRFNNLFRKKIVIDPAIDLVRTSIPPMMIQPLVENAIKHGLIHRERDGILKIELKKIDDRGLLFVVEDNGIGRIKAAEIEGERPYESKATRIITERIRLLNETHPDGRFGISYIDLIEENGQPAGTRVEVRMALLNGH
ncbi:MAG: histidine kinase, partial [bacterium]